MGEYGKMEEVTRNTKGSESDTLSELGWTLSSSSESKTAIKLVMFRIFAMVTLLYVCIIVCI